MYKNKSELYLVWVFNWTPTTHECITLNKIWFNSKTKSESKIYICINFIVEIKVKRDINTLGSTPMCMKESVNIIKSVLKVIKLS